jgi:transposase
MAKADKYGLRDFQGEFPDEAECLKRLFISLHNSQCSCGGEYRPRFKMLRGKLVGRRKFQCSKCRYEIAPMAGTIFQKSSTPLSLWFHAVFIFSNAKSGISAKEMERQLNVTYKCAYRILSLIRQQLSQNKKKLNGTVEMDEGYFGGKGYGGKNNELLGVAMSKKAVVIAAAERGGVMKAEVTPNAKADTIGKFLNKNIEPVGTKLFTDKSNRYDRVAKGFDRHTVDHGRKEFVRGEIHVNHIETFWAHVKRSIRGTHKGVSKKHLQEYLDGFVFHYNNRGNGRDRFSSLLSLLLA